MKTLLLTFVLAVSVYSQNTPSAYANVVTIRDLPPVLRQFYPPTTQDFIQAFVFDEPADAYLRVEVAYDYAAETFLSVENRTAPEGNGVLVIVHVADGHLARPIAIRVNGQVLWGAWPTVAVPRIRGKVK